MNTENEHNHEAVNENTINRQIVNTSFKRKALEDVSTRPKKIILQELLHNECVKEITVNDINRIRKNMYENRRKTLPANPKSIAEVHQALNVMNIETKQKENFLLLNDKNKNIMIFSCYTNLKFLPSVDTLYMDGTFDYCTRFFMQMFTIHEFQNGHYVPLVFCLLPNKLTYSYAFALRSICQKCKDFNLIISPENVTIDYEKAIINAVNEIWPESNIIGCRFHLTNS